MTSKESLTTLFNEANRFFCEEAKYTTHDLWQMCKQIQKDLEVLDILKHYAVNDGWSNGWVIKFWEMNSKELEKVNEVLSDDK